MASGTAARPRALTTYKARAFLWWAAFLETTIAGRTPREAHKRRRDRAMRAAHANGATLDDIAARTRLRPNTVRAILRSEATDD
jgi:hypothetical protein